jgi:hypothetical protein
MKNIRLWVSKDMGSNHCEIRTAKPKKDETQGFFYGPNLKSRIGDSEKPFVKEGECKCFELKEVKE